MSIELFNYYVAFDGTPEQIEQLTELMDSETMIEWFDNLDIDLNDLEEHFSDDEELCEDYVNYEWEEVLTSNLDIGINATSKTAGGQDIELCYFCSFSRLFNFAWEEAFKRCGITDYAIIHIVDARDEYNDEPFISIQKTSCGAFKDLEFVSWQSNIFSNYDLKESDNLEIPACKDKHGFTNQLDTDYPVMSLPFAKSLWSKLVGEDEQQVQALSAEDFVNLVNGYNYSAAWDKLPQDILEYDTAPEKDEYCGHMLNCFCTNTSLDTINYQEADGDEIERIEDNNFLSLDNFTSN